jgi:dipeptidyl aminopeptidase/acylaminoacyl peptidase
VLDPLEVTREEGTNLWTYRAKDDATGASVAVKLTREVCSDGMSDAKYTFSVTIEHAQIGTLKGCGQSTPDKFPEFRKKNQIDPSDSPDPADKDKDKKTVLDPITVFAPPVAVAFLGASSQVILSRGAAKKTIAPSGSELALSHDGKRLLFTRSNSENSPERSIVLYDADSGRFVDLLRGLVRQAFWSPDDKGIAFLKFADQKWQLWTCPANSPEKAAPLSPQEVLSLHGWVSANTILAADMSNAYWIGDDGSARQTVSLREIYGDAFQIMSSDTIRTHPLNPDLLLVSANYTTAPAGAPADAMGLNSSFFLYEIRSKRRAVLGPADSFSRAAEWSRDGLLIFFTRGVPGKAPLATSRLFWDGTGLRRQENGSNLVVGK